MVKIPANELKRKGVSLLDDVINDQQEAIITVRGESKYVVINMKTYNKFREYELEAALADTQRDLKKGDYIEESVQDHIKRITQE